MPKKLIVEEVSMGFQQRGWELLSETYQGSQKKLDVVCDQGHKTTITWNNFQRGQGCSICAGNQKFSLEEVSQQFAEHGFEFLDTQYVNNNVPVKCRCTCGRITKMPLCVVKKGATCLDCKGKKISETKSTNRDIIEKRLDENGHKYLRHWVEKESKSGKKVGRTVIEYICGCGKTTKAIWSNYKRAPGCWECGQEKKSGDKCHLWNPDRELVALNKKLQKRCWNLVGRLLSEQGVEKDEHKEKLLGYSIDTLLQHMRKHPLYNGKIDFHIDHIFPVAAFAKRGITDLKLINHLSNLRPLDSYANLARGDKYIEEAFDIWLQNPSVSAETVIQNYIVDGISSQPNIELINPEHAVTFGYYQRRYYESQNDSINVLFVFPHEWQERKEQLLHRARMFSGEATIEKMGARSCVVQQIDKTAGRVFCDQYHLQGSNKLACASFGLFDKDKRLVGVLTLGKHHRDRKSVV